MLRIAYTSEYVYVKKYFFKKNIFVTKISNLLLCSLLLTYEVKGD